jgi:hypothetical protein
VAVHPCPVVLQGTAASSARAGFGGSPYYSALSTLLSFPSFFSNPARISAFVSAIIAPQLNTTQHILIKSLLKQGFENKLIASEASCSVRAVQRIRLKQFEMPTPRTNRVGRRSCITSLIQKALCDILIEKPYLY